MDKQQKNSARASAPRKGQAAAWHGQLRKQGVLRAQAAQRAFTQLQITFSIALVFAFAILLTGAAPGNPKKAFRQSSLGGLTLGNYPDTSLPLSTDMTVTPDAPPTNTVSINVSTSTDFKGTLEGDPATGVVRVTDAHPAGTYTVMVTAFDGGGATATKTFMLSVTTPVACNEVNFAATNFGVGTSPRSVAVGDFNGDGKQDLAVVNSFSDNVSILLGDGTGHFDAPSDFAAGDSPNDVVVGDFNGDGNQDLAVANNGFGANTVSIFLGDGAGHFSAPRNFGVGTSPRSVAVGDFNADGNQDLAVANFGSENVSILLGDGTGHFTAPRNFRAGNFPGPVAVGDFNDDGNQDLAVADSSASTRVCILLGDGTGHFGAPTSFTVGHSPQSVAVGDFNEDGKQDLAVANYSSSNVSILLGDGEGNFSAPANFTVGTYPQSVAVGDFNGDGKQDLAVANIVSDNVSILLGDGTGHFGVSTNFAVGDIPFSVAVGDFNGDGNQDLAVANAGSDVGSDDNVSILLRNCPVSQITSAATTCSEFSSGTADTLNSVQFDRNSGLIQRVAPRAFLYWVPVTAPAGRNIFTITQTITSGNFDTLFVVTESNVFDSDCVPLQRTIPQSGDTVTVRFNAPAAGTYFIGIKFNSQNLIGQPAPNPRPTVHYEFMTIGVPDSTSGLDLVRH